MSGGCSSAVRPHSKRETRRVSRFAISDGWPIAREDDLLVTVEERVEGVEEFLLRALLAGEELDVVDQQHVGLPVALAEFDQGVVLDRVDEFVVNFSLVR